MTFHRNLGVLVLSFLLFAQLGAAASPNVVISQLYGGGGNSGATLKNDFIELFNRGTSPVSLAGWSVQYASATGSTWQVTALSGTLAPGQYFLVQEAAGSGGSASLPTPDATGSIAMSATAGKAALVSSTTALTCGAGCLPNALIVDLVGFGTTANSYEGPGPTVAPSNTMAVLRASSGCTDTDSNASDFAAGAPSPRNTASPLSPCAVTTPTLTIGNVSALEGDSGTSNLTFTVSLTGGTPPAGGVTFDIATADGSATVAGNDYVASSLTGQSVMSTTTFVVVLNGDLDVEPDETIIVNVTNIVGATNSSAQATGTIVNDDSSTPPTGSGFANPSSLAVGDTTTLTVNVTPGVKPPSTGITVTADLSAIGSSVLPLTGSGTTFTLDATVAAGTTVGAKSIPITISDAQGRSSTTLISLVVVEPPPPADHIVISQLYGGGGNSGAAYTNDFVELFNPTAVPVDLAGWTLQYASATGTSWNNFQPLGGTVGAGEYYLVALASGGSVGAPLPEANIYGSINMSGTAGKLALARTGVILSGSCPISPANPDVIDFVGYGSTASCSEGNLSAPAPSNTTAILRKNDGNTDSNVNRDDFLAATPAPRRTAPIQEMGPWLVNTDPGSNGLNVPYDGSVTVSFSEPVDVDSAWYSISCAVTSLHSDATVRHTNDFKTYVITPNVGLQFGEMCTVTVSKDAIHDQDTDDSLPNTDTLFANVTWSFTVVAAGQPAPYPVSVHLTMGNPTNAAADFLEPNNYLMEKPAYSLSYSRDDGRPNWVSWHLDSSWYGSLARFDTFRPDPAIPPEWYRVAAFDFSLTGFDRGHMCPNADRDNENRMPINQETYLMSQMLAQAPDNNQGPWAAMENDLRSLVNAGDTELYIVSGPAGVGGVGSNGPATTVADGHIAVPAYTWKAALVLPKGEDDIARVTAATRTIAVIIPNVQGIRNNPWNTYLTTVDAVETLCGCDLFSSVPDAVENAVEAGINGANPPGVADQSLSTREDTAGEITLNAVSPNSGASFLYAIASGPAHGTLSGTGETRTYTPEPDFFGTDSFTFYVNDGNANSNAATVTITVLEVNDEPITTDDSMSTAEDTALTFAAAQLTANDQVGPANESGQALTVASVSATADTHGTVALTGGQITYLPEANYNGAASFAYRVCDDGVTAGLADPLCADAVVIVTVTPVNDPPTVSFSIPTTAPEGSAITATATVVDIDGGDTFTLAWSVTKNGVAYASGNGGSFSFMPDDNGAFLVAVTVTDSSGGAGSASQNLAVTNVAPTIGTISGPTAALQLGAAAAITVGYTDPGAADTHAASIEWDDGTLSNVPCAGGVCSASHTYATAGVYGVTIVVSDDDGGVASARFEYVIVVDPAGPFVTGGGWINSPPGAYPANPTLTGKVLFGFVAKYLKGRSVPMGETVLQIQGTTFVLYSTSYEWLVAIGGKAQYRGSATAIGGGSYGFLLTAVDGRVLGGGAPDRIRIKVWNKASGAVVYDNVPGAPDDIDTANPQAIGGGSIIIHGK